MHIKVVLLSDYFVVFNSTDAQTKYAKIEKLNVLSLVNWGFVPKDKKL